jgi:hypothetical protein
MRKWIRVFNAARGLIKAVGTATEDGAISQADMSKVMKAMWVVIRAHRGY